METKAGQHWLVLSHAFNMNGRAASLTITEKIPHLLAAGITPVVVSAKTGRKDAHLEHHPLFPLGPAGLRFDLRHVLRQRWGKDWHYRLTMLAATLGLAPGIILEKLVRPLEPHWSWWWPAYRKSLQLIRAGKVDVIYSTGGAYAAHVAGAKLKQATGLPWIAEIHDPLVNPGTTPHNAQDRMRAEVERLVCTHADIPFWFTEQALASALARHPQMGGRGKVLLPGANPPTETLPPYQPGEVMVVGHFGSLSTTRHLASIVQALEQLLLKQPETSGKIELHLYGSELDPHTRAAIQHSSIQQAIRQFGWLEHGQVLEKMRSVDVLLLQHGVEAMCREYIPSKLYEYLWMQRPILGLVYQNPQLEKLLQEQGHTAVAADDFQAQTQALSQLFTRWRTTGLADNGQTSPWSTEAAVQQLTGWATAHHSCTGQTPAAERKWSGNGS
jgi:hypothetical protein